MQSLANKSAKSAQDIAKLIETSMQLVSYGSSLSSDTTQALVEVISSSKKSTELVERIAESAVEQSTSLKQLTQGMEQISDVVQSNAATAEKSAASAQKLNDQAAELKRSVQRFQLRTFGTR